MGGRGGASETSRIDSQPPAVAGDNETGSTTLVGRRTVLELAGAGILTPGVVQQPVEASSAGHRRDPGILGHHQSAASLAGTQTETTQTDQFQQIAKLTADDGDSEDQFGSSVAVSKDGTTAIIGAQYDEDPNGENAGSAYVFEASNGQWQQAAKLTADDGDSEDLFGRSVAMSGAGTTAIIGADIDEDPNGENAGSAYVFDETGGEWRQRAKLLPDDGDRGSRFGSSVTVSDDGTTAIIGAVTDDDLGVNEGSAYVFEQESGQWRQAAKLTADDGNSHDHFGSSVAVSGDGTTAIISAHLDEDPNGENAGSTYVFGESGGEWTQQAKLVANDGDSEDFFGWSVAVSGDGTTAIIGATRDEDPNGQQAGSAYVFEETGGEWTQQAKLSPNDGDDRDRFGVSVAMSGDGTTAIITANFDEDPNGQRAGSAYVFKETDGGWTQQAKLAAKDGDSMDFFGSSVTMSSDGETAVIGASDEDPNGDLAGSAYVFESSKETDSGGDGEMTTESPTTEPPTTQSPPTQPPTTQPPTDEPDRTTESTTIEATTADAEGTTESGDGGSSEGSPGFGLGSAVATLGGLAYLLKRRLSPDETED